MSPVSRPGPLISSHCRHTSGDLCEAGGQPEEGQQAGHHGLVLQSVSGVRTGKMIIPMATIFLFPVIMLITNTTLFWHYEIVQIVWDYFQFNKYNIEKGFSYYQTLWSRVSLMTTSWSRTINTCSPEVEMTRRLPTT